MTTADARYYGGFLFATVTSTPASSSVTFLNTNTFTTLTATYNSGGMFYINNNVMNININSNMIVTSSTASNYGGVFYIAACNQITMAGNTYQTFYAYYEGSFMYSTASNLVLNM